MNSGNDLNNTLNNSNENLMNTFNNLTSLLADSQIVNYSLNEISSGNGFQIVNQLGQPTNGLIDLPIVNPPIVNSTINPILNEISSGNEFQIVNQLGQSTNGLIDPP